MNFMEYVCRGIVRSEDAILRLNKNVVKLAKCTRTLNTGVACVCVAGIMMGVVILENAKDIANLQKQVKDLTREVEELKEQKGA